jgi:hypothetical protein
LRWKVHLKMWWWCLQMRTCDFTWNKKRQKRLNTKTHSTNFDGFPSLTYYYFPLSHVHMLFCHLCPIWTK